MGSVRLCHKDFLVKKTDLRLAGTSIVNSNIFQTEHTKKLLTGFDFHIEPTFAKDPTMKYLGHSHEVMKGFKNKEIILQYSFIELLC